MQVILHRVVCLMPTMSASGVTADIPCEHGVMPAYGQSRHAQSTDECPLSWV